MIRTSTMNRILHRTSKSGLAMVIASLAVVLSPMRNTLCTALGLALMLTCAAALPAQPATDYGTALQHVATELRALRQELLKSRIEWNEQAIASLERDLAEARKAQARLQ